MSADRTSTTNDRKRRASTLERKGYTIDRTCYPWVAYKGARFAPDVIFPCATPAWEPQ